MQRRLRLSRISLFAFALAIGVAAGPAHAGRPLATEDAGVADPGECEIETWAARQPVRGAGRSDSYGIQPACGLELPGLSLPSQFGVDLARERDPDGRQIALGVSGKTALRELSDDDWGLALAWSYNRARPTGENWRSGEASVLAVLSVPLTRDWLVHGNLGWVRDPMAERRDAAFWSAAIERTGLAGFDLVGEVFGISGESAWINAGLRYWVIRKHFSLNASAGAKPAGGREALYTVGAKLEF
ncbi:MAG: hypothetical protein U5L74_07205 [Ideonella sp.]|nr:hypothetical protein [Ideonella sp.]